MNPTHIPVSVLAEDALGAVLAQRLIDTSPKLTVGHIFKGNGFTYIKEKIPAFNNAAKGIPLLALSDLVDACPVEQLHSWLPHGSHHNLLFRIAVKESESWILADTEGMAQFLNVSKNLIPTNVENLKDPKETLINLASKSRTRLVREAIVPKYPSAKVGPDYNSTLSDFVRTKWDIMKAAKNSPSLSAAISSIQQFQPIIET